MLPDFFSSWQFLTVAAAFIWACCNIIDKNFVSRKAMSIGVAMLFTAFASLPVLLAFPLLFKISLGNFPAILLAFLAGASFCAFYWFYYRALQLGEVSRLIPVFQLDPIFTAVLSTIFLGELFSAQIYFGVVLVVGGTIALSLKRDAGKRFRLSSAFWYMLAATLVVVISDVLIKLSSRSLDLPSMFFFIRLGVFACSAPLLLTHWKKFSATWRRLPRPSSLVLLSNLASVGAAYLFTKAISLGFLTLVGAISALQPLFVLLIAAILSAVRPSILKEEMGRQSLALKLAAILVVLFGSYLVAS